MIPNKNELFESTRRALGLSPDAQFTVTPIVQGGSDRFFYRFHTRSHPSFIVLLYNDQKKENSLYADIARFLKKLNIQVPLIFEHDERNKIIWMEDVGQSDLYSIRDEDWIIRREFYRKALKQVNILHHKGLPLARKTDLITLPSFNVGLYEWEHHYFLENLINAYFEIELNEHEAMKLGEELGRLEERLMQTPTCLIHRDFQSQNIMLSDDSTYLIDFQGIRGGSAYYDLGSLLYDPYVDFKHKERIDLLEYYYDQLRHDPITSIPTWENFLLSFYEASAQRLMQALGAYGFLGLKKHKAEYLSYIKQGLINLLDCTYYSGNLQHLQKLSTKLLELESQRRKNLRKT
ncbi:MAG: phosphotransferase [Verrucomicrobiota bacterium]